MQRAVDESIVGPIILNNILYILLNVSATILTVFNFESKCHTSNAG